MTEAAGSVDPGTARASLELVKGADSLGLDGTATTAGLVEVEHRGSACWLTLNRPHRRNALTPGLIADLQAAVTLASHDPAVRAIVIRGNGPSFCAGADLRYLHDLAAVGADPADFLRDVSRCFSAIAEVSKPVIAVVHGHCVAGGLELALACDIVVAADDALIGDGHVRNGLIPAAGSSVRFPQRLPEPIARLLMLTGRLVRADWLAPFGFPQVVTDGGEIEVVVDRLVGELGTAHAGAQSALKNLLLGLQAVSQAEAYEYENRAFDKHWASVDMQAALSAFVAGRNSSSD